MICGDCFGTSCLAMTRKRALYFYETAGIASINPLTHNLGGLFKAGGHPQTPGRKYPAPLFQQSHYNRVSPIYLNDISK